MAKILESFRLEQDYSELIEKLAKDRDTTKSDLIREAIVSTYTKDLDNLTVILKDDELTGLGLGSKKYNISINEIMRLAMWKWFNENLPEYKPLNKETIGEYVKNLVSNYQLTAPQILHACFIRFNQGRNNEDTICDIVEKYLVENNLMIEVLERTKDTPKMETLEAVESLSQILIDDVLRDRKRTEK